ncbi:hypothetical protein JX266_007449 [Neoarthrinium moseri]|uniref:uncharacterized protein n=1 Tax=Neoarthrinium moseri TaxID=1658444 RepID=UPI001FDDC7A1|nr:uncharacterized protein JN550_007184 [Neoarthrinium moseri]KAI1846552.1 hypothetical protein JX266_007449 [Neoarthrinium moseri]KAI1867132.1 hypothetical protein JN550_007184 [Neoarthrinium moseri]
MIIGIVFTAEYYATYYASGAWIFTKERNDTAQLQSHGGKQAAMESPMPKITGEGGDEAFTKSLWVSEVNGFYKAAACDNVTSCAAYDQPPGLACFASRSSSSGIYCFANQTSYHHPEADRSVMCPQHLLECDKKDGGGCCPYGTLCATEGCLIYTMKPPKSTGSTAPTTSTGPPFVIATAHKMGEVPQSKGVEGYIPYTFGYTSNPALKEGALGCALLVAWMMVLIG